MGIGLGGDHEALRESVTGWAGRYVSREAVREAVSTAMRGEAEERPAFWAKLAAQDLLGLHVPEEHGGAGYGLLEAAVAIEALAEKLTPGPLVPTVLASAAILAAEGKARAELVPGLAEGTLTGAVALTGSFTGTRDEEGALTVTGAVEPVLGGALADVILVPVVTGKGEEWVALPRESLTITPIKSLDLTRGVARVEAKEVPVPAERVLDGLDSTRVRDLAVVVFGAEAVGLAAWCVETAADYAKIRVQFGRPIGQFQAVKHKLARMLIMLEQARATVWDAARAQGDGLALAVAIAGVVAPDAAVRCAKDAIQIFGGVGYTFEHDVHLYLRRAMTLRALLGPSSEWSERVADLTLAGVTREMKIDLPEEAEPLRAAIRAEIDEIATLEKGRRRRRALARAGFVMPHLPRPWGRDASPLEQVIIHQELRAAKVKLPHLVIGSWVVPSIAIYGTPEQQERFLPFTLSGEMTWCQLFSEPDAGSDLASLSTKAEKVEGGWLLTGRKIWTSLAHDAEWAICLARSDPNVPKHDGITYFLVDMKSIGITIRPLPDLTGDSLFNEVFLDDVFVPDDMVVGTPGEGWQIARDTLSNERVSMSGGASSLIGTSVSDLLGLISRLGRDLTAAERLALAELVCEAHSIAAISLRVTLRQLAGSEPGAEASVRKLLSTCHAQHVAECAVDLLGSSATVAADMRLGDAGYWNRAVLATRAMTIYGGTTEVQLNIIGERMLGLPRDPEPGK